MREGHNYKIEDEHDNYNHQDCVSVVNMPARAKKVNGKSVKTSSQAKVGILLSSILRIYRYMIIKLK